MKILVIHGSMRKGNTYALTKEIMNRLTAKQDVEIVEFSVANLDLPFCCSCHACLTKGEEFCPHYKIINGIKDALINCDGAIFTGTTYLWALNAATKNLLDHFAYLFHRPRLFDKKGIIITTSAGNGEKGVAKYMKDVLGNWGINGALILTQNEKEHRLHSSGAGFSAKGIAKIDSTVEKFYGWIKSGRQFKPSLRSIAMHNALRAMSLSDFSESEKDTQYWRQKGLYDRAYPVKAGTFRYLVGTFI